MRYGFFPQPIFSSLIFFIIALSSFNYPIVLIDMMHDVFDDSLDNMLFTCALISYSMHNMNLEIALKP